MPDVDIDLEWFDDLVVDQFGGIQTSSGALMVSQQIVRELLTNSERLLGSGLYVPADYVFDKEFGIGAGHLIGEIMGEDERLQLKQAIREAIFSHPNTDTSKEPQIDLKAFEGGHQVYILADFFTIDGQPGRIVLAK